MALCPLCGPKLSLCGIILGVWGIIMLSFLGLFFRLRSPALAMDIPTPDPPTEENFNAAFNQTSSNCFVAAGIYLAVLLVSAVNFKFISMKGTTS